MARKAIFDAIKAARGANYTQAEVARVDALLDSLSVPMDTASLTVSKAGLDLIKSFESCKLTAYPDPGTGGDPWTIGWGSTGSDVRKGTVWTQAQADARFTDDVGKFSDAVLRLIGDVATSQPQFSAMVSLSYNIGATALAGSTLLKKHNDGDYAGAAAEFSRWNKAAGKVLPGLTRRRAAEAALYRS